MSCDYCLHDLIDHQSDETLSSEHFNHINVIENVGSLIDVQSCDSRVTLCMVTRDGDGWKLMYRTFDQLINTRKEGKRQKRELSNTNELIERIKTSIAATDNNTSLKV